MLNRKIITQLREELLKKREELVGRMRLDDEAWTELQNQEIEFEERAGNENLERLIESLDEQALQGLSRVQKALRKIQLHRYGICEACGRQIKRKRLEAMPDAERCLRCVPQRISVPAEESAEVSGPAGEGLLPEEFAGLDDTELAEQIWERIRLEGNIPLEELDISCADGVVEFEGYLPNEQSHQVLWQFLTDTLGLQNVEDHIVIDPLLWSTAARRPGVEPAVRTGYDIVIEGKEEEAVGEEEGQQSGLPVDVADELMPEKE